jgi:putative transposase
VDAHGVPLSLVVTGANRHDSTQVGAVLDRLASPVPGGIVHWLYADKGYDGEPVDRELKSRGYKARVSRKKRRPGRPPKRRRWVVEVTHSWFNRFRKLLVRFEKKTDSYLALLHLAAAIICWRKVAPIYG